MAKELPKEYIRIIGEDFLRLVEENNLNPDIPSDVKKISDLRKQIEIPKGYKVERLNNFIRTQLEAKAKGKTSKSLLTIRQPTVSQGKLNRELSEHKPFDEVSMQPGESDDIKNLYNKRTALTEEFIESIRDIDPSGERYPPEMIDRYVDYINKSHKELKGEVARQNKIYPPGSKVSRGHQHPVSKSIDNPANIVPTEPLIQNQLKGNRYSLDPKGQKATGNFADTSKKWSENWRDDFLVWADRPENGGSGILSQRGLYSELEEQKLNEMSGIDYDNLSPEDKIKAGENIQDEIGKLENRNPFDPSQQAKQREWGILSQDQSDQMGKFAEETNFKRKPRFEVSEVGRRLGGVGSKFRTADAVGQFASGNYLGGGLALALQNQGVQKQVMKRLARFGGQQVAGMAPGAGAAMAALETQGYASQGRWTQAGIAAFSGIVGEIPLVGDAISGAADLTNTVIDITTGNLGRPSIEDQHADIDNQRVKMGVDGFLENVPTRAARAFR